MSHPVDDENVAPIPRRFASTVPPLRAKKFPPYIFSIRGASCLVHKTYCVDIYWWRIAGSRGEKFVKVKKPLMIATTMCSAFFRLEPQVSRMCHVPSPDALLCGRCHGDVATFPRKAGGRSKNGLTRMEAHVKLGCAVQAY